VRFVIFIVVIFIIFMIIHFSDLEWQSSRCNAIELSSIFIIGLLNEARLFKEGGLSCLQSINGILHANFLLTDMNELNTGSAV
jgi:hypothetical protein